MYFKDFRTVWKQLIMRINILLGGTDATLPTSEELEVMINYAQNNWHNLSLSDIELAVNANISRKTNEYIQFFGKVSVNYLQSCISGYQDVKQKAILEFQRKQLPKAPEVMDEPDHVINLRLFEG